jgi:hypothetical protein
MRVMRFNDQKNLTELVRQLFKIGKTPGTHAAALRALADANPGLDLRAGRLSERLEKGTLLVVPNVEGATHTRSSRGLGDETVMALLRRAKVVIADADQSLEVSSQQTVDQIKARIDVLESQELRQAARGDPEVEKRVGLLTEEAHHSLEQLVEQRTRQREALQAANETVSALVDRVWAQG